MKLISKTLSTILMANMLLGGSYMAHAASAPAKNYSQITTKYRTLQKAVAEQGAMQGLKELGRKVSQSEKTLFQGVMNEVGRLPDIQETDNGVTVSAGSQTIAVEYVDLELGLFKIGGVEFNFEHNTSLDEIYNRVKNAGYTLKIEQAPKSILEESLAMIFVEDAHAFSWVALAIGVVAAVVIGLIAYNAGKKEGRKEVAKRAHYRRNEHYQNHHADSDDSHDDHDDSDSHDDDDSHDSDSIASDDGTDEFLADADEAAAV